MINNTSNIDEQRKIYEKKCLTWQVPFCAKLHPYEWDIKQKMNHFPSLTCWCFGSKNLVIISSQNWKTIWIQQKKLTLLFLEKVYQENQINWSYSKVLLWFILQYLLWKTVSQYIEVLQTDYIFENTLVLQINCSLRGLFYHNVIHCVFPGNDTL